MLFMLILFGTQSANRERTASRDIPGTWHLPIKKSCVGSLRECAVLDGSSRDPQRGGKPFLSLPVDKMNGEANIGLVKRER